VRAASTTWTHRNDVTGAVFPPASADPSSSGRASRSCAGTGPTPPRVWARSGVASSVWPQLRSTRTPEGNANLVYRYARDVLPLLETFCAVAEYGSLTRAAEHLNLSQPAVTRQLKTLERQLGAVLVTRTPQGVSLTAVGQAVLPHARQ